MLKKLSMIKRNACTAVTAVICLTFVLYSVFGCSCSTTECTRDKMSRNFESDHTSPSSTLLLHHTTTPKIKKLKVKLKDEKKKVLNRETTKKTIKVIARATTEPQNLKYPVENKWSKQWPRINIGNCSHIEYMNRGLNLPSKIKTFSYPRTGIASFPGSGNTWTRYLIQQATGLWTGSVYTDKSLFKGGFKAELDDCEDGGTVAIKAHYPGSATQQYCKFDRTVLVIRDPYRAVLAEFNWRATGLHTGIADPRLYKTKLWMQHVVGRSDKWLSTTTTWIERFQESTRRLNDDENPFVQPPDFSKKLLLVSYERMKKDSVVEMDRVVKFLGLPEFRKKCVQLDADGNFHRASASSESIECLFEKFGLKEEVQKRIDKLAQRVRDLGIGDITAEFEGIGGETLSEKCKHV